MRIVFMGTPQLAADVLEGIAPHHDVVGVFTRPDAVRGRGKKTVPSQVKSLAQELQLDVYTPTTLKGDEAALLLESLEPDLVCVVAYGALLPRRILETPRYGCINAHMSLLPRWRGAAPVQRAILAGDEFCGVSVMKMEEGLDTGPYCVQRKTKIGDKDLSKLEGELAIAGSEGFEEAIALIEQGRVEWIEQPEEGVTYAHKIGKAELALEPSMGAWDNVARVRASSEAHPARASIDGRSLTVLKASLIEDDALRGRFEGLSGGQACFAEKRLIAMAADGLFEVESVKPDGKKAMDARSFAAGIQGIKGKTLTWERA